MIIAGISVFDAAHEGEAIGEVDLAVAIVVYGITNFGRTWVDAVFGVVAVRSRCCSARFAAITVTVCVSCCNCLA